MGLVYRGSANPNVDFGSNLGGSFNVENLVYPSNLDTSEEYGGHRVVFFINVAGRSKFVSEEQTIPMPEGANPFRIRESERNREALEALAPESVSSFIQELIPQPRRLKSAIMMYMSNQLINNYSVTWSEEDMFTGSARETIVASAANALGGAGANGRLDALLNEVARPAGAILASNVLRNMEYAQARLRMTPGNSKMEQLFKGVNFRDFTFNFQLAPKNEKDAAAALAILRTFRHHMLPEFLDRNNFIYVYPSEFDIRYYFGDKENPHLEKQITAVLTNMVVNSAPNGQFNSFSNGMPTQLDIALSFRELAIPSKETSPVDRSGV